VEIFVFDSMDLGMFDIFYPSLKTRALIDERKFDMSNSDNNSERYVIPMYRKNVWNNKWMQDPRKKCLQVNYYDPSKQYRKGWESFKRKRGLTLCYSCKNWDIFLRNALGEDLVVFVAKIWNTKYCISLE
jgi:hypothetical protein